MFVSFYFKKFIWRQKKAFLKLRLQSIVMETE